ncbi:PRKR-interacting protein 1 homolog [Homalodisca vitripennis]|uniref:PRKR-interacting protein 1 homolog n=1 Tax=Homalodisca vitripennis TaxID=197043 RepID=UPI001EEA171D|nr:PRKR-interacting protein 1 homolog [Homalodisca vitripennis]
MMGNETKSSDEEPKPTVAKNAVELQRFKLEKLMKNPDKPVVIPDRVKDKKMPHVPEFVRNVMGSSAGAGSGEFHVYRHLRRKEYARQKFIQEKSEKQLLEEAYHQKLLDNKQAAEEKTAKKRAKRLKKKANRKKIKSGDNNKKQTSQVEEQSSSESENERTDEEEDNSNTNEKLRLQENRTEVEVDSVIISKSNNSSAKKHSLGDKESKDSKSEPTSFTCKELLDDDSKDVNS